MDYKSYRIKEIAEELKTYEHIQKVFIWKKDAVDRIDTYMEKRIQESDILLLLCSQHSLRSEPVKSEWMRARKQNKPIIPVFTKLEHIPHDLKDIRGEEYDQFEFKESIERIAALIKKKCNLEFP